MSNDAGTSTHHEFLEIQHDLEANRFLVLVAGETGFLHYSRRNNVLSIDHTVVPDAIGGRGIAGQLVRTAFDYARDAGLKVAPRCPYADTWLARHPQYAHLRVD